MKQKSQQTNKITWFEFWNPGQAAALAAETTQNQAIIQANTAQDKLEAEMTAYLSRIEAEEKQQRANLYKNIALAVAGIVAIYIVVKYV